MVVVVLLGCALAAYWAGQRGQRYVQARADVRDTRIKLRKARDARTAQRKAAVAGWLAFGVIVVLAVAAALAATEEAP